MNVIAFGLVLSFLWGVLPVIHKAVLNSLHPQVVLFVSGIVYFVALLAYAAYNWKLLSKESKKINARHMLWLTGGTVICTFLGSIIYYYVLSKHDSHIVTAIAYSSPFFALVLAWLFLDEKVTAMGLVGVLLIVAGVVAIGFNCKQ